MVTLAKVEYVGGRWQVKVDWGSVAEVHGPYRWRWVARLVAWANDGIH